MTWPMLSNGKSNHSQLTSLEHLLISVASLPCLFLSARNAATSINLARAFVPRVASPSINVGFVARKTQRIIASAQNVDNLFTSLNRQTRQAPFDTNLFLFIRLRWRGILDFRGRSSYLVALSHQGKPHFSHGATLFHCSPEGKISPQVTNKVFDQRKP